MFTYRWFCRHILSFLSGEYLCVPAFVVTGFTLRSCQIVSEQPLYISQQSEGWRFSTAAEPGRCHRFAVRFLFLFLCCEVLLEAALPLKYLLPAVAWGCSSRAEGHDSRPFAC